MFNFDADISADTLTNFNFSSWASERGGHREEFGQGFSKNLGLGHESSYNLGHALRLEHG